MGKIYEKGNSKEEWQKRITKLEQQRIEGVQKLWKESDHPINITKELYNHSLKTGLYYSTREKQGNLLASLHKTLTKQQEAFASYRQDRDKKSVIRVKEIEHCSLDPTVAIRLFLSR